jgi:prepilin-type N-terminal cleavage/methylation domain-containing protein
MQASRKRQGGFGFVELLLVVTAVAVLVVFAYTRMEKREDAAREATAQTVAAVKARDEQLCDISAEYCTDEQKRERTQAQRRRRH